MKSKTLSYYSSSEERLTVYEKYRYLIREKNITSIKEISEKVQKPYDTVMFEIQHMIDDSYLLNIYIDKETETITSGSDPKINSKSENLKQYNYAKQYEFWLPCLIEWESSEQKYSDFKEYKSLIEVDKILSIMEIAKIVNKSERDVMLEIQLMLDEAYISDIHINAVSKTIIPSYGPRVNFKAVYGLADSDIPKPKHGFFETLYESFANNNINIYNLSENEMLRVFNQYRYLIKGKNIMSISTLEEYFTIQNHAITIPVATIIQMMIDECYLANYHIDLNKRLIVPTSGPRIDTRQYSKYITGIPDYVIFDSDKQKYNTFEIYKDLIRNKNITSIDEISNQVYKPANAVMLEIQKMIDEQYILDVHIDENTKTIIPTRGPKIDIYATIKKLLLSDAEFQNGIRCPKCGAINEFGEDTCEYCGTKLR